MPPSSESPFFAAGVITESRYFVGRRDELAFLTARMKQATSVNVVGKPKIGKSSLLYHFANTYEQRVPEESDRYAAAYLSLEEARCRSEEDFYRAVAQEFLRLPKVRGSLFPLPGQNRLRSAFENRTLDRAGFAAAVLEWKDRSVLPVLCLDEFEKLFDNTRAFDDGFYDGLRSLVGQSALMLVVASRLPLGRYSRKHKLTSRFFNTGRILSLQGLTEGEADELARKPDLHEPFLGEGDRKIVLEWGDRHPYLLQLAGSCLAETGARDRAREEFDRQAAEVLAGEGERQRLRMLKPLWWIYQFVRSLGTIPELGSKVRKE